MTQADEALALARASGVATELRRKEAETAVKRSREARVAAPFGGSVLRKFVEAGEVVAAGTPLVTLVDLSKLHAKVYVAEAEIGAEFTPRDVHMKDERAKQVFAVTLAVGDAEGVLEPGMPVGARIRWSPEARWGDGLE